MPVVALSLVLNKLLVTEFIYPPLSNLNPPSIGPSDQPETDALVGPPGSVDVIPLPAALPCNEADKPEVIPAEEVPVEEVTE